MAKAKAKAKAAVESPVRAIVAAIRGDAIRAAAREFVVAGDVAEQAAASFGETLFSAGVHVAMLARAPHNGTRDSRPVVEGAEAAVIRAVEDDILDAWAPDAVSLYDTDKAGRAALSAADLARRSKYVLQLAPRMAKVASAVGWAEYRSLLAAVDAAPEGAARDEAAKKAVMFKAALQSKKARAPRAGGTIATTVCGKARADLEAAAALLKGATDALGNFEAPPAELDWAKADEEIRAAIAAIERAMKFIPASK